MYKGCEDSFNFQVQVALFSLLLHLVQSYKRCDRLEIEIVQTSAIYCYNYNKAFSTTAVM